MLCSVQIGVRAKHRATTEQGAISSVVDSEATRESITERSIKTQIEEDK